ncbi:bifunctional 4-hydroxy-2-oxoglutarate aldolase/2-dehydro-3-deoxy-phosphogluconate aldolase [Paenibacillus daejeonensis]|uniref:bifunctional 4-hydroxy-2-oxoglutarate aldolase/2-dehydro-3-deoxy-phosphogluconate aldolase n=1 Tax=Paenibacillus daejeonensis TaxID=135193 RepID=UPI00036FB31F|nr:bifunctional 4-hydroxy-2-oxoglutarate aldolase/2-dehydro-3-deoxy-phosphogluconate aldolase [Paenibacillus daejeonensis]
MHTMTELLMQHKIVAIFRNIDEQAAEAAAQSLIDGGIRLMEVTMNTKGATGLIHSWRGAFGEKAAIGAGTVLDVEMAKEAIAAGAQFLISPNLDEAVISYGAERDVPVWPGVMTPTEIVKAWKAGAEAVKVFPMASLGLGYLKEIRAPLNHIPMIATGGVDLDNIRAFIEAGAVGVGMGSKLVRQDWIANGEFDRLREQASRYVQAIQAGA